jgi:aspartate kinase
VGMRSHSGVAAAMFKALGDAGINIANITTSDIKISCIVAKQDGERALQIVHDAFELDKPQGGRVPSLATGAPDKTSRRDRVRSA